ncbi:DNA-binding transcriptional regulator, LysR family [Duganella sacchari]|uniref:DNA-binding transcriptional regulator, LysR family n=1 Tax=Duganella sacchari TaxID=551987 RepID=A0A1M7R693_9BURK|nr:LysR substrate-binding domain-containing protein [Duganella sacchari]SHN40904.1 DNA-binding transcriptional regulator, LysR family [Duganella sacchari]
MTDPRSDRFVRSHLKTRHLVLLVELGRHGSIAHAAQAANLTQPGASKLLGELEHALGVQLFERLSRGVAPTWYGKVLIRRAGAALAEMDAAHQEVMELLSGLRGRVGVGTVLTPATGLVPKAINLLKARHARVHVSVNMSTSKALVERLRSGELDLVVGRILDTEAADELNFEPLTDEPHVLIARASHPLMERDDLKLDDLMEQCWILPPAGSILRDRLTALFLSHGLEQPAETVETLDMPVVASLLLNNDMIVALPAEAVQPYLDVGLLRVVPFDLGVSMDSFGIVTRKRHQLSPGADAMLTALRDAAASIYPHYRIPARD